MNSNKQHREEIARALILCANAYLEMDNDSSDDDMDILMLECDSSINKDRAANAALTVPKWSGDEYKMFLNMSAETFEFVYQLLAPRLQRQCHGMPMVDARLQIMVAIHKLTSSNTYRQASITFNMTKSTGYICIHRVINALHSLAPAFIRWPCIAQAKVIAKGFEAINGFPGVVGNDGCCRLRTLDFMDKALEGVILQVICDSKKRIIHCNIAPASSDPQSGIAQYLSAPTKIPQNTHLIANNSYSLQENVMVPYFEENNEAQKFFSTKKYARLLLYLIVWALYCDVSDL